MAHEYRAAPRWHGQDVACRLVTVWCGSSLVCCAGRGALEPHGGCAVLPGRSPAVFGRAPAVAHELRPAPGAGSSGRVPGEPGRHDPTAGAGRSSRGRMVRVPLGALRRGQQLVVRAERRRFACVSHAFHHVLRPNWWPRGPSLRLVEPNPGRRRRPLPRSALSIQAHLRGRGDRKPLGLVLGGFRRF